MNQPPSSIPSPWPKLIVLRLPGWYIEGQEFSMSWDTRLGVSTIGRKDMGELAL